MARRVVVVSLEIGEPVDDEPPEWHVLTHDGRIFSDTDAIAAIGRAGEHAVRAKLAAGQFMTLEAKQ